MAVAKWAPGATIGFAWLLTVAMYPELPIPAPEGSLLPVLARPLVALCLPTAATVTYLILRRLWGEIGLERAVETTSEAAHRAIALHVVLFIVVLHVLVLLSLGGVESVHNWEPRLVILLFGAVFIATGNLLPRTRPNLALGIRTTRTLTNRHLWIKLHRACGYVAVAFGAVVVIAGLFFRNQTLGFLIGAAAISSIAALMLALVMYQGDVRSTALR